MDKKIRSSIIFVLKNKNKSTEDIQFVIEQVKLAGGILYAQEKMETYKNEALNLLSDFPPSEERTALMEMVRYTTERKK